ncbi:hypothetical protein, partial [Hominenteromicrobium sp.]|uniref:hypothetical protein n=1 Tax=Hominenteromicrobium sp. TaxID=3073581 RepID=UPI003A93CA4A
MRDKTYHAYLDSHERQLVIHSLVELKNRLIQEGRYTDCVDELIFKVVNAPVKKMKIESDRRQRGCFLWEAAPKRIRQDGKKRTKRPSDAFHVLYGGGEEGLLV